MMASKTDFVSISYSYSVRDKPGNFYHLSVFLSCENYFYDYNKFKIDTLSLIEGPTLYLVFPVISAMFSF